MKSFIDWLIAVYDISQSEGRQMGIKRVVPALVLLGALIIGGCSNGEYGGGQVGNAGKSEENAFPVPQYEWNKSFSEPLVIWGIYPDLERSYITKAFERYEELTGNRLEIVQVSQEKYEEQMTDAFLEGGDKPDVVLSYGGTNIERYNPDENFYDFIDAPWVQDLTDTSVNQTIYNGRVIGLPHWEASISGTVYNKKIFEKYKLSLPATQEEFQEACRILLDNGVTPLYMPGKEISMLLYQFPMDYIVEDSEVLNGLNGGTLTYEEIPEMEQIVKWYRQMAQEGYLGDSYLTDDWSGMEDAMSSGEYAMMLCWDTWLYTDFQGDAQDFGLMPAFIGVPEEGTFEGPNLGLFMVTQNSSRLESALNFITFLADPYNYNVAFDGIYTAPVFKNQVKSISTPQYQEAERLIERNYRDSTAWLRIRGFSQMDASAILEYMDSSEGMTAKECLRKMDSLRNKRLNCQD